MILPITAAFVAAILIVLQQSLMLNVGIYRGKANLGVGVGNDKRLERKHRRHANLAENSGIFVVTLAIAEIIGLPAVFLAWVGAVFVIGRMLHAIGFSSEAGSHLVEGPKIFVAFRAIGAFSTLLTGIALGLYMLYQLILV